MATVSTNTVGPLLMAKYFSPLLMRGGGAFGAQPSERSRQHRGLLVNMTARVGSIGDNGRAQHHLSTVTNNIVTIIDNG